MKNARMAELADAADLKFASPKESGGSIPPPRTITMNGIPIHVCEKAPKDIIQIDARWGIKSCPYCGEEYK
jgi:uncharacterized Zn-finger protein